jgi:hypothetical protein
MFESLNMPTLFRQRDMTNDVCILTFIVTDQPGYAAFQFRLFNPKIKIALRYSFISLSFFKTLRFVKHEDNFTIS